MENKEKKAADRLIDRIKIIRDRLDQIPHEERWTEAARLAIIHLNGGKPATNRRIMKITNWLKAGRRSKKDIDVIANVHCNPAGSIGDSKWDDYVQFSFFSKEKMAFVRLTMTVEEAERIQAKLSEGLKKFQTAAEAAQ